MSRMDAQSESEARQKGAADPTVSAAPNAAPNAAQRPAAPRSHGFSTAQILVMAASGCVFALAVLILIVLAGDPSLGTLPQPLVANPVIPKITAAFEAPLRSLPPPAPPAEPPAPAPTEEPAAAAPPPTPSPPSLGVVPAPSPSTSPLVPARPSRTTAPPPPPAPPTTAAPPPTQQSNPGPLFQRED
jgi:hypothetical protein